MCWIQLLYRFLVLDDVMNEITIFPSYLIATHIKCSGQYLNTLISLHDNDNNLGVQKVIKSCLKRNAYIWYIFSICSFIPLLFLLYSGQSNLHYLHTYLILLDFSLFGKAQGTLDNQRKIIHKQHHNYQRQLAWIWENDSCSCNQRLYTNVVCYVCEKIKLQRALNRR